MPFTVTRTTTRTFAQTIRSTVGTVIKLSFLVATGYAAWYFGNRWLDNRPYAERKTQIEDAIKEEDFEGARKLFAQYREKDLLKPEQIVDLERQLAWTEEREQRANDGRKLEAMLAAADAQGAEGLMQEIAASGRYSASDIANFKQKIEEHSESGIFDQIRRQPSGKRVPFADRYLKLYPGGPHAREVVEYVLHDSAAVLTDALVRDADFDTVRNALVDLNSTLDQYAHYGVTLPSTVSPTEVEAQLAEYADTHVSMTGQEIAVGTRVRITPQADVPYDVEYLIDRNRNFPAGSLGTVLDKKRVDQGIIDIFVLVNAEQQVRWRNDYNLTEYWGGAGRNVARYREEELIVVAPLSPKERAELKFKADKLPAHFRPYQVPQ